MDLNLTPQEEEFRQQVRNWLAQNRPVALHQRGEVDGKTWAQRAKDWQRRLYQAGYLALSWPKEYGGQALDPMRQAIVNEELMRAGVPGVIGSNSISMLGPTLITWGTEEQKRRYLPKILTARGNLVPGLLGAGRRLGPGFAAHPRRPGRRRVRRQRPEGMDLRRTYRRHDVRAGAHQSRRPQASRAFPTC